jgi:predicted ATPase
MRFWEPSPDRMREPSFPGATVLGDFGDNLATALQEIRADAEQAETLASWVRELTPMDVEDFEFPLDPSGRVHLTIREKNDKRISAYSASEGTLRFLAVLTALLGKNPAGVYFFEEIDAGIHPARQWLVLALIEKQAAKRGIQVITTTHSPDMLTFVNDDTFEHLSAVCRLEDSHDAVIRSVAQLPNARDLRTSQGGLGRLLAENWMETALAFTEGKDKDEER